MMFLRTSSLFERYPNVWAGNTLPTKHGSMRTQGGKLGRIIFVDCLEMEISEFGVTVVITLAGALKTYRWVGRDMSNFDAEEEYS